jgi:hypothetical protein
VALGFVASLMVSTGVAAAGFEFGVKPSTGMQGSTFGFSLGEKAVLFGGLDFMRATATMEQEGGDIDVKAQFLMPNVGAKLYLGNREEGTVAPYLLADIFKAMTSIDLDVPGEGDLIPNETIESIEELLSPIGFNVAFGAEYYFSDNFSMLGEYGIRYFKTSSDVKASVGEMEVAADISASLAQHFVGFGVNFRF